jgi:Protein of unknown function (DUF3106)
MAQDYADSQNMRPGKHRASWLAAASLAIAVAISLPCLAFGAAFQGAAQPHPSAPATQTPPPRQPMVHSQPPGHAGDWLRRYKDLPPAEQEHELQNDPAFRRLPPQQQQLLRQRLQHFSSLPPQQQLRMLNRMETWEHLTPAQKQQARQIFSQFRQLPPERRRMMAKEFRSLRELPPEQREQVIDSPRFKGMFSDQEREMMRGAARLPLAPPEGGEGETQ